MKLTNVVMVLALITSFLLGMMSFMGEHYMTIDAETALKDSMDAIKAPFPSRFTISTERMPNSTVYIYRIVAHLNICKSDGSGCVKKYITIRNDMARGQSATADTASTTSDLAQDDRFPLTIGGPAIGRRDVAIDRHKPLARPCGYGGIFCE